MRAVLAICSPTILIRFRSVVLSRAMFSWIVDLLHRSGPLGVLLLMTLENVFPPIPSELIMPMAGYEAARGVMSPWSVIVAGTLGSVVGAMVWYAIGRRVGIERLTRWAGRYGRWLTLTPSEITRMSNWFLHWGAVAVLLGRTLPGVRGVICIPAGIAAMPIARFAVVSTLGSFIWCALLTGAGLLLRDHYLQVERWLNPLTDAFMFGCGIIYLLRVVTFRPDRGATRLPGERR